MKKKGFTLIELIAVLVILAILALIVTPLVMNIIRKAKISADKRSVDAYGRSVELAIATHLLDTGTFPTDLKSLTIEYTGKEVICNIMQMKENGGIYLSECTVGDKQVKDDTEDGYYHYGTRDLINEEYVDMYGLALKNASVAYYEENGAIVEDYRKLTIDYKGKPVACEVTVNYNGTIYMTKCKVNNVDVTSVTEEDGYYHYGSIVNPPSAVNDLLAKANPVTVTNYTDGNTKEMYTFEHPATIQTGALTDYRYIGANPNNYVTFNNELWRIIGVFIVDDGNENTEYRVKIVRNMYLDNMIPWDVCSRHACESTEWSTATLNTYLNEEYYSSLSENSQEMIALSKYYLGGSIEVQNLGGADYYNFERGNTVYPNHSIFWTGKIALMYPSDYVYTYSNGVDNKCFNNSYECYTKAGVNPSNGWMFKDKTTSWFISPSANQNSIFASSLFFQYGSYYYGRVNYASISRDYYGSGSTPSHFVRPTLYLKSSVKIISGDGSEDNPYQLSL